MNEAKLKQKKKIDYELLRKLEDEYDEAVEDLENKEELLIKKVHSEYLKAENKGEFFKELHHAESWYYTKFKEHELNISNPSRSEGTKEGIVKSKVQSIINDLDEMEREIQKKPVVEIDEDILENEEYVDPVEQEKDWIHRTKIELQSQEPKAITLDSKFGKYQETKGMIDKIQDIRKTDFNVGDKYRTILLHKLDKAIDYLTQLRRDINDEKKN